MRAWTSASVLLLCASLSACGAASPRADEPRVRHATSPRTEITPGEYAERMNAFGLDVWSSLRTRGRDGNFALSPASIATALAMTHGGARELTAREMAETMHLGPDADAMLDRAGELMRSWNEPHDEYRLSVANRIFAEREYRLRAAYLDQTRARFGAEVERMDFRGAPEPSRRHINDWVLGATQERIRDLIPAGTIDEDTRAVLVNAVYFRGLWARAFPRAATHDEPFLVDGEEVSVPMMHGEGGRFLWTEEALIAELPYRGERLAMMVVVPTGEGGLPALEAELDAARIASWARELREVRDLEIALPRFRIETDAILLGDTLQALGMRAAFSDAADFGAMVEEGEAPLAISDVVHRVFVEVNEEGTEAAAATAVVLLDAVSAPPSFRADRPFLFFIRDTESGAILFAGRVVDPRA